MTNATAARSTKPSKLPAGVKFILPTASTAFVVTMLLGGLFSFGNVWDLAKKVGVEHYIAPLIGPVVDVTAVSLMIVVPWLIVAGVPTAELKPAIRLMRLAGFLTLALNSGPSILKGVGGHDPNAWNRALIESIVPLLMISWSHVGPALIASFVGLLDRRAERVEALRRAAEEDSMEAARKRQAEVAEAVEDALRGASAEWEARLAEALTEAARESSTNLAAALEEAEARHAEELAAALASDRRHREELEAAATSEQQLRNDLATSTDEIERLRESLAAASAKAARQSSSGASSKRGRSSVDDTVKVPRKSAAELLEERVEAAKEALPMWQIETPSGPEIASALGLKSAGVISEIRKRLDADRLALVNEGGAQ